MISKIFNSKLITSGIRKLLGTENVISKIFNRKLISFYFGVFSKSNIL